MTIKPSQILDSVLTVLAGLLAMVIVGTVLASMHGCTVLSPTNEIRVTEYGGDGSYLAQAQGQVAGCRAVQNGTVKGCMRFESATCKFKSEGCK